MTKAEIPMIEIMIIRIISAIEEKQFGLKKSGIITPRNITTKKIV
jgi:hypothetical protein